MKKILLIGCLLCFIFGVGAVGFVLWSLSPVNSQDVSLRPLEVVKGDTGTSIGNELETRSLIHSGLLLRVLLKTKDSSALIQTGTYELSPSMSTEEIVQKLIDGPEILRVTFKEGVRAEEISEELINKFGMRYFDPAQFLVLIHGKEGMLFPDTYDFSKQVNAATVVSTLLNTFEKKYAKAIADVGPPLLPKDQTVILASLVEREARDFASMKIVAGILENRLAAGIPLQVDSTLQYLKGYNSKTKTWWSTPLSADKRLVSPFNTYMNKGLPPSPICNPGLNALEAAMHPTSSDYLYYLSDPQGGMHYAHTLEEHTANIDRYLR